MKEHKRPSRYLKWLGMTGVDPEENPRAKIWARRLEWPLIFVAILILIDWYNRTSSPGIDDSRVFELSNWMIWGFFTFELGFMLLIVNRPVNYLRGNWMSLVIVLAGVPFLIDIMSFSAGALRSLRLLLFISIFLRLSGEIRVILARHNLGITLLVAFSFLVLAAFLITGLDPAFTNPSDGFWWALITMTTVGYGDFVPTTLEGRIVGMLLILAGFAIFSILTASFSVFFIERDGQESADREIQALERIELLESRLERIDTHLELAVRSLERLEARAKAEESKFAESKPDQ